MRMRTLTVLLALAACAPVTRVTQPPPPPTPFAISSDGRSVTAGGETWTTAEGISFFQRGNLLHVVSSAPGRRWDVEVSPGGDGKLAWPQGAPFEASGGTLRFRAPNTSPEIAALIESGQLYPHEDHYHLTHKLQDENWQALYREREEGSPLPAIRRQVAATVLATLVDERIPASSPEATEKAIRRLRSIIGKARRALDAGVPGRSIQTIITYDVEITDEGRTLDVGGQIFHAADPVRFAYCAGHFHVEHAAGKWAQVVELEGQTPGAIVWPTSMFFQPAADGTIVERTSPSRWRTLSESGQIRFTREHWHVTETYANPRLQRILKAIDDPKLSEQVRDRARALALDLMRLRLDTGSDAEFEARLQVIDQVIDRAGTEFERELKAPPARR